MTRRWPDVLPGGSFPGYDLTIADPVRRTEMEVGSPRVRQITKARLDHINTELRMTDAQMAAFRAFHADEPWSIAGDSESMADWTFAGCDRLVNAGLSPDLVLIDRMREDSAAGTHYAQKSLSGALAGGTVLVRASIKALGRNWARLNFVDRDGDSNYTDVDLVNGVWGGSGGIVSRTLESRGGDWWRVTLTADVGSGGTTPLMRISMMDDTPDTSYTGDGASRLEVAEIGARMVTGYDLHLRTDADGNALGAGNGAAWVEMPVVSGGGLVMAEARFSGPYSAQAIAGLRWIVKAKLEVRNA